MFFGGFFNGGCFDLFFLLFMRWLNCLPPSNFPTILLTVLMQLNKKCLKAMKILTFHPIKINVTGTFALEWLIEAVLVYYTQL